VSDFAGFSHMAKACVRAGDPWVTAFAKAKFGHHWGLGSAALGLPLSNQLVYHRELRRFGSGSLVKPPSHPASSRYRMTYDEPSFSEKVAFGINLFDYGRDQDEEEPFNPSRNACLKHCPPSNALLRRKIRGQYFHMPSYAACRMRDSTDRRREWCVLSPGEPWHQVPREEKREESLLEARWRLSAQDLL